MLTPALLALHNEAVARLPSDRALIQKESDERIATHFAAVKACSDRLINALEKGDVDAAKQAVSNGHFQHNDAFTTLLDAVQPLLYPVAASSSLSIGTHTFAVEIKGGPIPVPELITVLDPVGAIAPDIAPDRAEIAPTATPPDRKRRR